MPDLLPVRGSPFACFDLIRRRGFSMTIVLAVAMMLAAYACLGVLFWVGACLFGGQLRQWSPLEHLQWMLWLAFFWIVLAVLFADWSRRRVWA